MLSGEGGTVKVWDTDTPWGSVDTVRREDNGLIPRG